MEVALILILFLILGTAVAACAFCWWLVSSIVRGIWRVLTPAPRSVPAAAGQACGNADCRCANPTHARFCRRCGRSLPSLVRTIASRAAML